MFYDYDGPKLGDGTPIYEEVTVDMLKRYIEHTQFPCGHGYVVAALVAGIQPEEYTT